MTRPSLVPPADRAPKRTPDPHHDPTPPATDAVPLALAYTIGQAAKLLNVSKPTAYRLTRNGALPSVLIGGCRRITHVQLTAYLAGLQDAAEWSRASGLTLVDA